MIDYINSLDRKGLIIIGRKVKAPGYLNDFSDPYQGASDILEPVWKRIKR